MKIRAVTATLNETENAGQKDAFTAEQLQQLANTAKGKPVTTNFDKSKPPVGNIVGAWVEDGRLLADATLFKEMDLDGVYLVPGFLKPEFRLVEMALTKRPADKTLSPIQI